ncbi:ferric reductase like transmembrane component-domain-containing protein [Massariosphaeria phaeospora]|uniref:Ferric reductase like transmembrane component-domain-containing protein n=1 Tax=Massariosphaeria phaeospora TaxID=100035 RepID=A0A7C8IBE9_9PLEO|nr:ferric reductase like transmembrane component-domain-containing protein [Massariosphaeria phaeospora]
MLARHEGPSEPPPPPTAWAFGYAFVTLDDDQKLRRRELLEWYPFVAQLSVLAVLALFQLGFLLSWLGRRGLEHEPPKSPSLDKRGHGKKTWLRKSRQNVHRILWWMKKPVVSNWGTRGEWVGGVIWTVWLLYLSIAQTGNDYFHLTKRFGIIGASQLPLHYLLAMRTPYSPIQFLTRLSHEELKASHQILGRIVFFLFALHAALYLNLFVLFGVLAKRIKDLDVIWGVISIIMFCAISTTALGLIRRWNYRVFYTSHVVIANLVVITLFFHVSHIRLYLYQVVAVIALHLVFRTFRLKTYSGTIKLLSGTNLVQIRIPLATNSALAWKPGQHVYLSRPVGASYSGSYYDQLMLRNQTNPFSVASIPAKDKELLLVAKTLNGNTKKLAELARTLSSTGSNEVPDIPLALEGPYGASTRLPDFSTFDSVLLVAGGVGATFIMPIYRSIVDSHGPNHAGSPQIRFIWAVQKLADTQWAFPATTDNEGQEDPSTPSKSSAVEVFVTRPSGPSLHAGEPGDEIELAEDDQLLSMEEQMERPRRGMVLGSGRPNVPAIVDEVFSKGTSVAIITCGPKRLTEQLSRSVEQWVKQGHEVYWHDETFGW